MATRKKSPKSSKKTEARVTKSKKSKQTDFESAIVTPSSIEPSLITRYFQSMGRRRLIILGSVIVLLGVGLFIAYKFLVLALVDNVPISRISFYQQLDQKYGKELKDQLITEQLIQNEAKKRNLSVSADELTAEIKKLEDQQGGKDKLDQVLQLQGISQDELKKQLTYRLMIQKMFGSNVTVTDDEVNKYMTDNKEQFVETNDQVKAQVKEQLLLQKVGQAFNSWLSEAKTSNRVINY